MITRKLDGILKRLEAGSQAENRAVAECLREIASNGGEQSRSGFLAACADNLRDAASVARDQLVDLDKLLEGRYASWQDAVARGATKSGFSDWCYDMYKAGWIKKPVKRRSIDGTTS